MRCSDFTVLVAEDDPSLLNVYVKSLSMEGYRVIPVKTCERALADLYEEPPDLLIADIKMEDMDGFEMLELLMRNQPKLPVIMFSGNYEVSEEEFHKKGFMNVKAFYMKPLSMDILKLKIREVLKIDEN